MTAMTALRQQLFCCHSCPTDSNSDSTPTALRQCPTAMTAPTARAQGLCRLSRMAEAARGGRATCSPSSPTPFVMCVCNFHDTSNFPNEAKVVSCSLFLAGFYTTLTCYHMSPIGLYCWLLIPTAGPQWSLSMGNLSGATLCAPGTLRFAASRETTGETTVRSLLQSLD